MSNIFDKIRKVFTPKEEAEQVEGIVCEFCPRCNANLPFQKGYDNSLPYWICRGCGEMLINPAVETETDIAWICDKCGMMLNIQPGFSEDCGEWICTECGYKNLINETELYFSEEEYFSGQNDPYKGLPDEAVLALSEYEDEEYLADRADIILVKHRMSGQKYVKKFISAYNKSIYEFLRDNPVDHMPRIIEFFEGDNYLIVIEEYIGGRTVAELMGEDAMEEKQAITIAKDVCGILENLHGLQPPIIHRDIKPSNIMIPDADETYLLDVNAARWYDSNKNNDTVYMGTQSYAAPEQAGFGLESSSGKSDIYSLGVTLNVMLTGCFPKEQKAGGKIWTVIEKCISMDADKRYSAKELKAALSLIEEE